MEFTYNLKNAVINEEEIQNYINEELVGSDFLVTDEEGRKAAAREYIEETLWAFNTSFIMSHSKIRGGLSTREYDEVEKSINKLQGELCESANSLIKALIEDMDEFIEDAISSDGYGHFLSQYDGDEIEYTTEDGEELYIYRQN